MDNLGDALTRIKNGYRASKLEVSLNYSKLILEMTKLLAKEGYIEDVKPYDREIIVKLKYTGKNPALTDIKRISKPGLRVYKGAKELPSVLGNLGIAIISTPKGLMTNKEARKEGVGGEVMAFVW